MLLRRFLGTALACLIASCASTALARKPSPKNKPNRARRAGPPRQVAPSLERYKEFQQALADRGYFTGPVNGAWGPESVDALKRFQQDQSLAPDGKLVALSIIALGLGPKREPAKNASAKTETPQPQ